MANTFPTDRDPGRSKPQQHHLEGSHSMLHHAHDRKKAVRAEVQARLRKTSFDGGEQGDVSGDRPMVMAQARHNIPSGSGQGVAMMPKNLHGAQPPGSGHGVMVMPKNLHGAHPQGSGHRVFRMPPQLHGASPKGSGHRVAQAPRGKGGWVGSGRAGDHHAAALHEPIHQPLGKFPQRGY